MLTGNRQIHRVKNSSINDLKQAIRKVQDTISLINDSLINDSKRIEATEALEQSFILSHSDLPDEDLRRLSARYNYLPILIKIPTTVDLGVYKADTRPRKYGLFTGSSSTYRNIQLKEFPKFPEEEQREIVCKLKQTIIQDIDEKDRLLLNAFNNDSLRKKFAEHLSKLQKEFAEEPHELLAYLKYKVSYLNSHYMAGKYDEELALFIELKIYRMLFILAVRESASAALKEKNNITEEMLIKKSQEIANSIETEDFDYARAELEITLEQGLQSGNIWQRMRAASVRKTLVNIANLEVDDPETFTNHEEDLTSFLQASKEIIIQPKPWQVQTYFEVTERAAKLAVDSQALKGVWCAMLAVTGVLLMLSAISLTVASFGCSVPLAVMGMGVAIELVGALLGVSFTTGIVATITGLKASLYYFAGKTATSMIDTEEVIINQIDQSKSKRQQKKSNNLFSDDAEVALLEGEQAYRASTGFGR